MASHSLSHRVTKRISQAFAPALCVVLAASLLVCLTPYVREADALDTDTRASLVEMFRSAQERADAAVEYALATGGDPLHALADVHRAAGTDPSLESLSIRSRATLPARYSLTAEGTVTYAKQQGIWNTCWAFADIGALESAILKYEKKARGTLADATSDKLSLGNLPAQPDLSEHALAWYNFTLENAATAGDQAGEGTYRADRTPKNVLNAGGNFNIAMSKLFAQESLTTESHMPYTYRVQTGDGYAFSDNLAAMYDDATADLDWGLDETIARTFTDTGYRIDDVLRLPDPAQCEFEDDTRTYLGYNPAATEAIKETLMDVGAVSVDVMAETSNWWDVQTGEHTNYDAWCQYYGGNEDSNHRVLIVGWDDSYPAANFTGSVSGAPEGDGAWLVKNSWGSAQGSKLLGLAEGTEWGLPANAAAGTDTAAAAGSRAADSSGTGFYWVSYYDHSLGCPTAYKVAPLQSANHHTYQYDHLGTAAFGGALLNDAPCAMANIFTTNRAEVLDAVSVYTALPGATADIDIYLLNETDTLPTDGRLIRSQKTVLEYEGNYSVNLEDPVQLAAGQRYSIVQTIYDQQEQMYHLNLELAYQVPDFYDSHAIAHEGETMALYEGEWLTIDEINTLLTEEDIALETGNALIKAYTHDDTTPLTAQRLLDEKSGIAVSGVMASNALIQVTPNQLHPPLTGSSPGGAAPGDGALDEGCSLIEKAQSASHALVVADLKFTGEYGRDIQIEVPVEGFEGQTLTVVSCTQGKPELLTAEVKDGHAIFRLKEPAPFALLDGVYTADQIAALEKPDTPDPIPPSEDPDLDEPKDESKDEPDDATLNHDAKDATSPAGSSDHSTTSAQTGDEGRGAVISIALLGILALGIIGILSLARLRKCW